MVVPPFLAFNTLMRTLFDVHKEKGKNRSVSMWTRYGFFPLAEATGALSADISTISVRTLARA